MARVNLYLQDDLLMAARGAELNMSRLLQKALRRALGESLPEDNLGGVEKLARELRLIAAQLDREVGKLSAELTVAQKQERIRRGSF